MPDDVTYRWIDGPTASDEDWNRIDGILATRGWARLNRPLTRILVAEDAAGTLVGFFTVQAVVHAEPLWVRPSARGGEVARELADQMHKFLVDDGVRGWVLVADSPVAARMAVQHGMHKIESPVYVSVNR